MPAERAPDGVVTVWQQRDDRWRWQWSPSEDGDPGPVSHQAFDSEEEARHSAEQAYPDAALPEPAAQPVRRRRRHRLLLTLALGAVVVTAVRTRRRP